jgi:2-haloacid dehalogenase
MPEPEVLAFDMYGTLVDPLGVWQPLADVVGASARQAAEIWRVKQLEYTFRLVAMERYEDFENVTRKALDYALAVVGYEATEAERASALAEYDQLRTFADVGAALEQLAARRHVMVVLSNGTPRMLRAAVRSSGLESAFQTLISVDEVRTFKPSPRVYKHAARRLGRPIDEIRLVSSNPFDVVGAAAAGMRVAWLNRSGGVFDTLAPRPDLEIVSLSELAERI